MAQTVTAVLAVRDSISDPIRDYSDFKHVRVNQTCERLSVHWRAHKETRTISVKTLYLRDKDTAKVGHDL